MMSFRRQRGWLVLVLVVLAGPGLVHAAGLEIPIADAVWTFEGNQATEYLG